MSTFIYKAGKRQFGQALHDSIMDADDYCYSALRKAMAVRKDHPDDWVEFERLTITVAANAWAVAHGSTDTITVADVERVEGLAMGHSDYASKLALYVAELIHGVREIQP